MEETEGKRAEIARDTQTRGTEIASGDQREELPSPLSSLSYVSAEEESERGGIK
jgi:hypothetical protein